MLVVTCRSLGLAVILTSFLRREASYWSEIDQTKGFFDSVTNHRQLLCERYDTSERFPFWSCYTKVCKLRATCSTHWGHEKCTHNLSWIT